MLDETAPDFSHKAVVLGSKAPRKTGLSKFQGKWLLLFFYPLGAEIESILLRKSDFDVVNCKMLGISCSSFDQVVHWAKQSDFCGRHAKCADISIIPDHDQSISSKYGFMLPNSNLPKNGMCLISPEGALKLKISNDASATENIDEVLAMLGNVDLSNSELWDSTASGTGMPACSAGVEGKGGVEEDVDPPTGAKAPADQHQFQPLVSTLSSLRGGAKETGAGAGVGADSGSVRDGGENAEEDDILKNAARSGVSSAPSSASVSPSASALAPSSLLGSVASGVSCAVSGILESYAHQLRVAPLRTKALTACLVALVGEVLGASISNAVTASRLRAQNRQVTARDRQPLLNAQRLAVFGAYGLIVAGPFFHWWYGTLERMVARLRIDSASPRLGFAVRLALSQLCMTPPFLLFTLAYIQYFLSLNVTETVKAVKRNYAAALFTNWKVWTVANAVNFQFVPLQYRTLFGNLVALWWNIYLSIVSSAPSPPQAAGPPRN